MNKKVVIIIFIMIVLLIFGIILYPVIENNRYQDSLLNNIYNNTSIKDITYLNKDNNYYIIKSNNKAMVLDLNYEELYSTNNITESNLDLTYVRNNLYYKERIREDDKLIYKYYNVETGEEVFSSLIGGTNE